MPHASAVCGPCHRKEGEGRRRGTGLGWRGAAEEWRQGVVERMRKREGTKVYICI